jgi:beta-galactosidase
VFGLILDWRRFVSHQTFDFMKTEIEPLKKLTPNLPVTTNMMPAWYDVNYNEFEELLDVVSWDSYPDWHAPTGLYDAYRTGFWHDYFRALKDRPYMLMESAPGLANWKPYNKLKRPGMDVLASLQSIAHGGDTVQYFQWRKCRGNVEKFHGAVVDHVGTNNTRIFKEVRKTGEILKKIDEIAGTGVNARVAIVFDWENWWALDTCQAFQRHEKKYEETCVSYYKPFWKRGIAVDVIGPQKDFSKYDLVIAPMLYMTGKTMIEKISAFVKNGGTFFATYMLGMVNETDLCYLGGFPAEELKEVFGIWNEEIDTLYPEERGKIVFKEKEYITKDYSEIIHPNTAKVLAWYNKDFYKGLPAYTVNSYGKGKAYYQAFRDVDEFKDRAIEDIIHELGLKGCVEQLLPEGVTAHTRTDGSKLYLFVENYTENSIEDIRLGYTYEDMLTGEMLDRVSLNGYDIRILKRNERKVLK